MEPRDAILGVPCAGTPAGKAAASRASAAARAALLATRIANARL